MAKEAPLAQKRLLLCGGMKTQGRRHWYLNVNDTIKLCERRLIQPNWRLLIPLLQDLSSGFPLPHRYLWLPMIQLTITACLVFIPFSYSCCVWRCDCDFSHTLAQLHRTVSLLPKVFCPHTFQSCGNICSTDASLQETKPGERHVAFGAPQWLLKCCSAVFL